MTHLCPRRRELPSTYRLLGDIKEDDYQPVLAQRDGTPYPPTIVNYGEPACTWCGSLQPERFMEMLTLPGYTLGPTTKSYKVYVHHAGDRWTGKFYFQHLDEAQQHEFAELLIHRKLLIAEPGYFTVLPPFVPRAGEFA